MLMTISADVSVSDPGRIQRESSPQPSEIAAHVLIVDDDSDTATGVQALLLDAGYNAEICGDAFAAVERMRRAPRPDLILLDLMMPRMDGWEFRAQQRLSSEWSDIPLVVVSGDNSSKARAIDADAFLSKPVDSEQLLEVVNRLLDASKASAAEARSRELERLSSLGVLAGGLAHEVNNPLAVMLGYVQFLRYALQDSADMTRRERVAHALDQIEGSANRIASVVREVANFARNHDATHVDIVQVVEGCVRLVANRIRLCGRLERHYEETPAVVGNAARLGQVILTLLIRAVHLLEEGERLKGLISLSIQHQPSGMIAVRITDSGPNMTANELARVFAPPRPHGQVSTGAVDLSMVKAIVQDLGGTIRVLSTPHAGTTFELMLPSVKPATTELPSQQTQTPQAASVKPRLLIIDDEADLCALLETLLGDRYDVTSESEPLVGLERALNDPAYDIVLCDLMMPGIGGAQIYETVCQRRPELAPRMMFMTGGAFTKSASDFLEKFAETVVKPFHVKKLIAAIEKRLQQLGRATGQVVEA